MRARIARRISSPRPGAVKPVLEPLAAVHRQLHPNADLALLQQAYDVAEERHAGQKRKSGDPYITHPLAVATILAELGMDTTTLVAARRSPVAPCTRCCAAERISTTRPGYGSFGTSLSS